MHCLMVGLVQVRSAKQRQMPLHCQLLKDLLCCRGTASAGLLWTQFNIALKHLKNLDQLILINWLIFRLLKPMTKRIFSISFLWISLLWNATVHFNQHFSQSQHRQTCLATAMFHYDPNYVSEVLLNSLKTCSVEIWTSVEFLEL